MKFNDTLVVDTRQLDKVINLPLDTEKTFTGYRIKDCDLCLSDFAVEHHLYRGADVHVCESCKSELQCSVCGCHSDPYAKEHIITLPDGATQRIPIDEEFLDVEVEVTPNNIINVCYKCNKENKQDGK